MSVFGYICFTLSHNKTQMVNILNSVALFNASPFRNLRRFSQVPVTNLPYFLAAIREMQQLQHLSLGFDLDVTSPVPFLYCT